MHYTCYNYGYKQAKFTSVYVYQMLKHTSSSPTLIVNSFLESAANEYKASAEL